ncbi:MAG: PEP-CTERM system TPR-repeat protein PrsT [Herminiimonas sp.]|nr:PEP-CTERM system TPR-repeat protein PrsT [Herminiimonas sp.]
MNRARDLKKAILLNTASGIFLTLFLTGCGKSQDTAALVVEAAQYQQKGDSKAAIIQLKNALQKDPENGEARFALGAIYADAGDALAAEKELQKAASLGVKSDRVTPVLSKVLMALGKYQKVLELTAPTAGVTETAATLALRGDALLAIGKREEAKDAFQKALDRQPDSSAALVGLAKVAAVGNDMQGATRFIDLALQKNTADGDAWMFKGDLMRANGRPDEAIKAFDEAIKLQPANITPQIARATLNITSGKYAEAKTDIDAARKKKPASLLIFYTQALLDFNQGKNAEALAGLQQVLKSAPEHMPSLLLAGAVQYALGSTEQAEQNLKKYLAANPENLYARKLLASTLLKNGNLDRASTVISDALKEAPQDPQLFMIAGESALQNRDYARATEYFEKAGAIAPKMAIVHTALGMSKLGQGEDAKAVSELELAAGLDEKSAKAGSLLVMTQLRLKQYDKALESVLALEKKQPNDPMVQNLKGGVYLGLKNLPMARSSFEKAVTMTPTYFPAIENLARLDLLDRHPEAAKKRFETLLAIDKKNVAAMTALAELAQASGQTVEATTWFEKAAAESPAALPPSLRLGTHYLKIGAKEKALALAQKLYASNDINPAVLDLLGQSQAVSNDMPGALATFKRLASSAPKSPAAQLRIASIHASTQNWPEAIAALNNALKLQPDNLEAQAALVSVYETQGDFDAALKVARQVQKQRPKQAFGYVLEGDIMMAQKKPALAQKPYEQALATGNVNSVMSKLHTAMLASGKAKEADARIAKYLLDTPADMQTRVYFASSLSARHDDKAAIEQYEIVAKATPQNPAVLNNLAYAYQQEKDPRALDTAERALKLAPTNPVIMDTLGWILVERGNDARGLGLLQKASSLTPGANDLHLHLAIALMKAGDKVNARKELEQLADSKTYSKADEARRLLKEL